MVEIYNRVRCTIFLRSLPRVCLSKITFSRAPDILYIRRFTTRRVNRWYVHRLITCALEKFLFHLLIRVRVILTRSLVRFNNLVTWRILCYLRYGNRIIFIVRNELIEKPVIAEVCAQCNARAKMYLSLKIAWLLTDVWNVSFDAIRAKQFAKSKKEHWMLDSRNSYSRYRRT